jgi:glycosyltransferase involved in cell wall biosynthesis
MGDWEMIVVDDGSSDRSAEVAESYARHDPRVRSVRQSNQYLSRARNNGVAQASPESRYLLFLDADDVLLPQAFETMSAHLDDYPEAGAAYNLHRLIDDHDLPLTSDDDPPSGTMRFEPILFGCLGARPIPIDQADTPLTALASYHQAYPSCTYFRREAFERAGGWDQGFADERVACEDKDLVLRVALLAQVHLVGEVLTLYRRHANNISSSSIPAGRKYFASVWRDKTFDDEAQEGAVRRALVFDSYLSAQFTLSHSAQLLKHRDLRHGLLQLSHGLLKYGKACGKMLGLTR